MQFYVKAIYAGIVAYIGSTVTALVQIGEGAAFGDVTTVAWLTIVGTTLAAVGGILGWQAAPASVSTSIRG